MTTITKTQCLDLIDSLADKSLTKGCWVKAKYWDYELELVGEEEYGDGLRYYMPAAGKLYELVESEITKILGHDILIGSVLAKMPSATNFEKETRLLFCWGECGYKSSLQSIYKDIEWEVIAMNPTRADRSIAEVAKSSPATDLFTFLLSLNLKN